MPRRPAPPPPSPNGVREIQKKNKNRLASASLKKVNYQSSSMYNAERGKPSTGKMAKISSKNKPTQKKGK